MSKKYFVTADPHSYFTIMYDKLVKRGFQVNNPDHVLVILGDIFDRGNQSREMYEFLRGLQERFIFIRGNHEDLLIECFQDILQGYSIKDYHFSNGTMSTIEQLCKVEPRVFFSRAARYAYLPEIRECVGEVIDWIKEKSINFYEVEDFIFVHGWIPCKDNTCLPEYRPHDVNLSYKENWRECADFEWGQARWINGIEAACRDHVTEPGKNIVCGHWHCSWGWSHILQKYKEFPQYSHEDFQYSFKPFIADGIIALDACTNYSKQVNCIIIEDNKIYL